MTPLSPPVELFAQAAPGLIEPCQRELRRFGFDKIEPASSGVRFWGDPLRASLMLSIPERILMPLARFKAENWRQLQRGAAGPAWGLLGGVGRFKISAKKSRLRHTGAIEERLRAVIPEGAGELWVRLDRDRCTLSLDASGGKLHQRGWRLENGPAPLRETLAAGLLELSGWRPEFSLHDPMCGSGTILIEAGLRAAGLPPGLQRQPPCAAWGGFEAGAYPLELLGEGVISGGDRSGASVGVAKRNAAAAGVELEICRRDARDATPPTSFGYLITNPPYQRRAQDAAEAFDALDALSRGAFARWSVGILCPNADLAARLKRPVKRRCALKNGGIPVELLIL